MKFRLSPGAVRDLDDIYDYSSTRWGPLQAETYVHDLHTACLGLVANPAQGRRRHDIPPPWLVLSAGSHLIIYRINTAENLVEVLNILHPAMNIAARLTNALSGIT
jgi:toxin ParE1/3/4